MRFSKIISVILHPIFMPIIAFSLSIKSLPGIGFSVINNLGFIYLVLLLSTIIMPLMSIFFLIQKNMVASLEMNNYKERFVPLIITAIWMCYGYYKVYEIIVFSTVLKIEFLCAIIIIFIAAFISKFWKISLHMLGAGGVVGVLFGINILYGGLLQAIIISLLLAGILGTARINEKAHNHKQVYAGFLIGFLVESAGVLFF